MSTQETAIAAYDPMYAALGLAQGEPLKPANLNLLQPIETADEEGLVAGRFRDAQSNMQFDKLDIVVLQIAPGRVCYPPESERGAKPLCRSRDGVLPVINDDLIRQDNGRGCATCPKSQWKKIGGRTIKPPCREVMNFLMADAENEFIFRYNVKGTSLSSIKELRETIRKSIMYAKTRGAIVPYWGFVYRMASVKIKNAKGTFFNPKFTPVGNLLDANAYPDGIEKMKRFGEMADFFMHKGKETVTEEPAVDPVEAAINGEYVPDNDSQPEYEAA
jgi:hypothetical protein